MDDYYHHRRHDVNYMRNGKEVVDPNGHATDLFSEWVVQRESGIKSNRAKLVALIEHMDDGIGHRQSPECRPAKTPAARRSCSMATTREVAEVVRLQFVARSRSSLETSVRNSSESHYDPAEAIGFQCNHSG